MERLGQAGDADRAMQQPAPLEADLGDVLIVRMLDGEAGQDRIAMVPMPVGHIAGIGGGLPDVGGKEVVLRLTRPVVQLPGMPVVQALDLLKENDVRPQFAQLVAQFMHHHVPMKLRKPLVNIIGYDVQLPFFHGTRFNARILSRATLWDSKIGASGPRRPSPGC